MKIGTVVVVLVLVFFAFPILNDTSIVPSSFDPNALGDFVRRSLDYWQTLIGNIIY